MTPILSVEGISKSFLGVNALQNVSLDLYKGEIHTILGENGAGKSTLMNILTGIYRPDSGKIILNGKETFFGSPADSIKAGIGMVYQHFMLVDAHTVYENILLSLPNLPFFLNEKKFKNKINTIINEYGLDIDIDKTVSQLSVGQQQWIEIVKLLIMDCKVLILDEPTAVLTPQESDKLFEFLKKLTDKGRTVVFISHKMKEVMELSNRVTVLKKGKNVAIYKAGEFDQQLLASKMIGDDRIPHWERTHAVESEVILSVQGLTVFDNRGVKELDNFSIDVRKGEIFGITGIAGNGQRALAETLTGLQDSDNGKVIVYGKDITNSTTRKSYIAGIAHIPEDRKSIGIAPDLSVSENLIMKNFRNKKFRKWFIFQNIKAITEYAKKKIETFSIKLGYEKIPIRLLSGGNIQKVIIARELSGNPLVLVALYPTRGLDIGSAEYVHKVMSDSAAAGMSIILISEDIDELAKMSDRLAVMFRGRITGVVDPRTATKEEIGLYMSGIKDINKTEIGV